MQYTSAQLISAASVLKFVLKYTKKSVQIIYSFTIFEVVKHIEYLMLQGLQNSFTKQVSLHTT